MAHLRITVDDNTIMDGDTGDWTLNPPELITDQLKQNARPAAWMRALMLTIADTAMTNQPTNITVTTSDNDGWTMNVNHTDGTQTKR